jgi:large subunit ribosomal protein L10
METKYKADMNKAAIKEKVELVKTVSKELASYPTIALIDLRKLPDALLQKIRKKVREGGGVVRILKKPVLERVLKSNKKLEHMAAECKKPMALIMTPLSPFQLYKFFETNKKKRAAKAGDIAPFDIIVPEGETDLPPGPALSELKTAGLNVQIKAGKIIIAKDSTVSKLGEKITDIKAKALQKVGVMPFEVSVNYLYGFDGQYVYPATLFEIDKTIQSDMQHSFSDAFNLSVNASFPTKANIKILLGDAFRQSVDFSLNGNIYSSGSIEQLLTSALRQGVALSGLEKKTQ